MEPQAELQMYRDFILRKALLHLLLHAGGEVTLFAEDLDRNEYQLMIRSQTNPDRLVLTLCSPERFEELKKQGASIV